MKPLSRKIHIRRWERCPYSHKRRLACPILFRHCPLQDRLFIKHLERFLFKGRTLQTTAWDPAHRGSFGPTSNSSELSKILRIIIFAEDFLFEEYPRFKDTGVFNINKVKCRALRAMRNKWKKLFLYPRG